MKQTFFVALVLVGLSTACFADDYYDDEIAQKPLPPFPECQITCPVQYYGAGDHCRATGQPGQVVSCSLALGPIEFQPDNTRRQSCRAVCSVK